MKEKSMLFKIMRASYLASFALGAALLVLQVLLRPELAFGQEPVARAYQGEQAGRFVYVAPFKLPITPVSAEYYNRLITTAEDDGAAALVVQLDTPGGLVDSMQVMVQRTLASRVPVIVYVSPRGAQAASAGLFIVYAGHLAAMAPNTTIGSAEVIFGGGEEGDGESSDDAALRRKATNELVAKIRSLAETHGRNADFAEEAVRESANFNAQQALDGNVVEVLALNVDELLDKADGRQVHLSGQTVTLQTKGLATRELSTNFAEDVLLLITNPSVAFLLISLGTLGITWEFINPGSILPGVVGVLCLLVGLLGLGTLPINVAGLVFLVLAFVLFIADIFTPTHGILTAGGIASLIIGGLLLINTGGGWGVPTVSPWVVTGTATGLGAFFFLAVFKVFQSRRRQPSTGREGLVGRIGQTRTDLSPEGMVFIEGELWHAISTDGLLPSGQHVRVVGMDGLLLKVAPLAEGEQGVDTRML